MWTVLNFFLVSAVSLITECHANLPPSFTRDMNNLALSENVPVGEVVFTLEGTDPENSTVKFGIIGTDLLSVAPYTGKVTVVKPLDHEVNDTLNFIVTIEDEINDAPVGGNNIVEVPVTIIVLDENDNVPIFQNVPYVVSVKEDAPIGTVIFNGIYVTDADTVGDSIEVECVNSSDFDSDDDACQVFGVLTNDSTQNVYHGSITLKQKLNYGKQEEYKFLLRTTDGKLNNVTMVLVTVEDVQDTPPIFVSPLQTEIDEDAPINTRVLTVHAEDGDRGMPRRIVYELVEDPTNYFLLDSATGDIRTARPLDKESIPNSEGLVTIRVKAIELVNGVKGNDPETVTEGNVTIFIRDINDEPPSFNKKEYFAEISENAEVGAILPNLNMSVSDPDTGNNSVFSLVLNDVSHALMVDPELVMGSSSVNIKIAESGSLDYEDPNQRKFIILVIAKEVYTNPQLSSTATVTVIVTDANDNAPVFTRQSYSAVISETAAAGTLVTTVSAKDRDTGKYGDEGIIYQLIGNDSQKFSIDNRTGAIIVNECDRPGHPECLDFETKHEYFFTVKAIDDDGKGQAVDVPLKITLADSNDNPPKFNRSNYDVFIDEGSVRFDPDLIITASDLDSISHLSYSIVDGNINDTFNIDSNTGKIRIAANKVLKFNDDEGSAPNNILLTIEATDGKYTATAHVNVTVNDVNDHVPLFDSNNYTIAVHEDARIGSNVIQVTATDSDNGINAQVSYGIRKGALDDFSIDNVTGVIMVASTLDYDRRNTYTLEVVAMDQGVPSLTGTTTVMVRILNVNNKLPYFEPEIQKAEVMKDAKVGTVIYKLVAFDSDIDSPEALNFAITEPISALDKYGQETIRSTIYKEFFSVDKDTGEVSVSSELHRDIAAVVTVTVIVTDTSASELQQGNGTLIITIADINDSPPQFVPPWTPDKPEYTLQLQEELPVGTIVDRYTAIDEDSVIAGYYIIPDCQYFQINNGTGILQVKERIDYERIQNINFTIVVYDSGTPQLNTSANIYVSVVNINDNDPVFAVQDYSAVVKENSPNGTHIITVSATDGDAGEYGQVTYSLAGEYSENIWINRTSGQMHVANERFFDHEMINETTIQVIATDGGGGAPNNFKRSTVVPVRISILDVNDNPPRFNQNDYNVTVSETVRFNPPFPIVQVFAKDLDEGNYGNVNYKIISEKDRDIFLLGEDTGILYVHKSLLGKRHEFHLDVEARDESGNGKFADRAKIIVRVLCTNEHRPNFIVPALPNATVEIMENVVPSDYLIITVKAVDEDDGENGKISFYLRENGTDNLKTNEFIINPDTGELRSRTILDSKVKYKYQLSLVAKDHGLPIPYETVKSITVLLMNRNGPNELLNPSDSFNAYHFYVTENSPNDHLIGHVKIDQHSTSNYYYLLPGNEANAFRIDKFTGKLYTNGTLDREVMDEYNLTVLVSDDVDFYLSPKELDELVHNKTNQLHNTNTIIKIKITITDLNDNPPKFQQSIYYAAASSSAQMNGFVSNVTAVDVDLGINSSFVYYIKTSNLYKYGSNVSSGSVIPSPFYITQNGSIYTAGPLIENNQHRFVVDVVAKETEYPEREGFAKLFVWIFDQEQLIRIILSRPVEEVLQEKNEIISELSNCTKYLIVIHEIKRHMHHNQGWSDMYILAVDPVTQTIAPVYDVLRIIDANYDFLKDYYAGFAIENVVPAYITEMEDSFDPALSALIALLLVLLVGTLTFVLVCCCLRNWTISPTRVKKKDALINKAIIDDLNTTENPLWIEQKLKIYEEQELSMQVFNEPEQNALERRNENEYMPEDNTYATIQRTTSRHGSIHTGGTLSLADDLADYATLSGVPHLNDTLDSRGLNLYEAAMGFQGSTFQVPHSAASGDFDSCDDGYHHHHHRNSGLSNNVGGQPEYAAELI